MNGGRVAKKGLKAMMKRKSAVMETSRTSSRLGKKKKRKRKIKRVRCIQKVRESLSNDKIDKVEDIKSKKCKYCQRYHVKKSQTTFCKKCYPPGIQFVVPFDKFSPREEVCEVFTYSL